MPFIETEFPGLIVFEPNVFGDERGYFFEAYNHHMFESAGISYNWVQDNQSSSLYGVIRGLHFQKGAFAQTKMIRCISGSILDAVVDLRRNSPTFKKVYMLELTAELKNTLVIPRGFAHGFSVLSKKAEVLYKCDNAYNRESEGGLLYNDPELNIDWKIEPGKEIVSEKDLKNPAFHQLSHDSFY